MRLLLLALSLCAWAEGDEQISVQKCCAQHEVLVDLRCRSHNETETSPWTPSLSSDYELHIGLPQCGSRQLWAIYHYDGSSDQLLLLPSGRLRHYTKAHPDDDERQAMLGVEEQLDGAEDSNNRRFHDYEPGTYCLDKVILTDQNEVEARYAVVCAPGAISNRNGTDWVIRKVVDPVCHGLAIACYLIVAVVYFVMPQLRDLVGNMLTTITVCLIVSQAADLVRIFTEFSSHTSFLVADIAMYMSLLGAFFWLNSLGYYIWKTFRSRNVFLRTTDGRKYCYYSFYSWGATLTLGGIALFAHFLLDTTSSKSSTGTAPLMQKTIGWLGIAIFFTPVAFTILVNIFFYLTTGQAISHISAYGRIHHKMKFSFEMFVKLFLVMAVAWLFLLLSWLQYDVVVYCHIVVNVLQAVFFLYITVLGQKRITGLLKQMCCNSDQTTETEWGEEMTYIDTSNF